MMALYKNFYFFKNIFFKILKTNKNFLIDYIQSVSVPNIFSLQIQIK